MGYGIPRKIIPVDDDGIPQRNVAEKWVQKRFEIESKLPLEQKVAVPRTSDIILGRGKRVQNFAGNINFRNMLEFYRPAYDSSSKFEKSVLIETILKNIKEEGGRFLVHGENGYHEVHDDTARKKISHAWRNLRSKDKESPSAAMMCPMKRESSGGSSRIQAWEEQSSVSDSTPQKRLRI
jgi:hypothetical protein